MKKSRVLALVMVACLMLMGAGYAAWNETVTISNTVNTGNLDVDMARGTVNVYQADGYATVDGLNRVATAELGTATTGEDANVVDVTITNLYPGAHAVVNIPITNNGSIPVKTTGYTITGLDAAEDLYLDITLPAGPLTLAPQASGTIAIEVDIPLTGVEVPENGTAIFSIGANYIQFNQ